MVNLRDQSGSPEGDPPGYPSKGAGSGGPDAAQPRLTLLLSHGGWQEDCWADLLPRLLEPMGVQAVRVRSGQEAVKVVQNTPVHIAVVDLSLPLESGQPSLDDSVTGQEAGTRLLELLFRLETPPPTLVIKRRKTRREAARELSSALSAGAFAVFEPPVQMETMLETMRRVLRRCYADRWPHHDTPQSKPPSAPWRGRP